jgi:ABC-type antimicrobial peptide transport system permease subunit
VAAWLGAPALSAPGPGLVGGTPAPPLTGGIVLLVLAVAAAVALLASLVPAVRAARSSTVRALADTARQPRRAGLVVRLSRRMPVPLLIGMRIMARRLRRTALAVASIFVTVSGIVAVTIAHDQLKTSDAATMAGLADPTLQRADQVLAVITVMLVALACVNAVFITRAMAHDAIHASAIVRALGATPQEVTLGLSLAQTLPALCGAVLGIPGGVVLFAAARNKSNSFHLPPAPDLLAVVVVTVIVVSVLTAIPARLDARRPVAGVLQAELA